MAKNLVYKATSDDREPPSGPILKELENLAKGSVADSEAIEEALLQRVKKSSANIKWKALKVIKHLALNGNPNIARNFQRQHEVIRECINFTGTQHPLYGDELNERVRKEAKDCIQAIFQGPTQSSAPASNDLESKIRGYEGGPTNYSGGSGGYSGGGGGGGGGSGTGYSGGSYSDNAASYKGTYSLGNPRLPGMGNSYAEPKASVLDNMKNTIGSTLGSIAPTFGFAKKEEKQYSEYEAPGPYVTPQIPFGQSGSTAARAPVSNPVRQPEPAPAPAPVAVSGPRPVKPKQKRKKGQVVGMFAEDGSTSNDPSPVLRQPSSGSGAGYVAPTRTSNPTFEPPASIQTSTSRTSQRGNRGRGGSAIERALIAELCSSAGVKSVPPKDKLDKICSSWAALDQWFISEQLDERLDEAEKWQVQKKALVVIENLVKIDAGTLTEYFQENSDNLVILATSSSQQSVMVKAQKLLQTFEIQADLPESSPSVGNEEDLVSAEPEAATPSPFIQSNPSPVLNSAAAVAPQADVAGLFGHMTISGNGVGPSPSGPTPIAMNPSPAPVAVNPTPAPRPVASQSDDLLSFLGGPGPRPAANSGISSVRPSGFEFIQSVQSGSMNPELSFGPNTALSPSAPSINLVDNSAGSAFSFMTGTGAAAPTYGAPAPGPAMGYGMNAYPAMNGFGTAPVYPSGYGMAQPGYPMVQPPYGQPGYGYGVAAAPQFIVQAAPAAASTVPGISGRSSSNAKKPDEFNFVQDLMSNH